MSLVTSKLILPDGRALTRAYEVVTYVARRMTRTCYFAGGEASICFRGAIQIGRHLRRREFSVGLLGLLLLQGGHSGYGLAQTAPDKYFNSPPGWAVYEVNEPDALGPPVLCGRSGVVVVPVKSGIRVVDPRRAQSDTYELPNDLAVSCSPDGRYLFASISHRSGKFSPRYDAFDLIYFDLESHERVEVFSGLTGLASESSTQLVSPDAKYVIGPKALGKALKLSPQNTLELIPVGALGEIALWCPLRWDGAAGVLLTYVGGKPLISGGKYLSKALVKIFDIGDQKWSQAESEWLPLGVPERGCAKVHAHGGRIYVGADTTRPGWHEGGTDTYEFAVGGQRLTTKKIWRDTSDFSVGRDGSLGFAKIYGIQYQPLDRRISLPPEQLHYEIFLENGGRKQVLSRLKLDAQGDVEQILRAAPRVNVIVESSGTVVAFNDPIERSTKIFVLVANKE